MVAIGYIQYSKYCQDDIYVHKAERIANTIIQHIIPGDAEHSPLPFRVNLKTGEVVDPYCSNMILAVQLFDELLKQSACSLDKKLLAEKRELLIQWILKYPMRNHFWSGYYEDVQSNFDNLNQQNPMETARYLLNRPETDPDYKTHVPELIQWVKNRFGQVTRYGATSIKEQDGCFKEMSSHTARYASVVAKWYGVCQDPQVREEARASFALATYSAYNKYSKDNISINYTGIEYAEPWFSDSYWDYLPHILDGIAELPEMLPQDKDHLFYSSSTVLDIKYDDKNISYATADQDGIERFKLTFTPVVYANGKPLDKSFWRFGSFRGVDNILIIERKGINEIEVRGEN